MALLNYCKFEESLHAAFPAMPIPTPVWHHTPTNAQSGKSGEAMLAGRTWPEMIGWRLSQGEIDLSLSIWLDILPFELFKYYLPAHLLFASILLKRGEGNYEHEVMECLILPPDPNHATFSEIEDVLSLEAPLEHYDSHRLALFHALTSSQKQCVADFLAIYWERHRVGYPERGDFLFKQNMAKWRG